MKVLILTMVILLSLSGCATTVAVKGAEVTDDLLEKNIWYICTAATVGSVKRAFAGNMNVYNDFCQEGRLAE